MRRHLVIALLSFIPTSSLAIDRPSSYTSSANKRYSFSLTTFSPQGHLSQVEYATTAANRGPPVIALCLPHSTKTTTTTTTTILLASPQTLPSPLISDDGTTRFLQLTPRIVLSHSGISADGRILLAAAQRVVVEYMYTFEQQEEEGMPLDLFLEEMSHYIQKYTCRGGSRPFGCSLLVVHSGDNDDDDDDERRVYRIDPSGSVECMGRVGFVGGLRHGDDVLEELEDRILSKKGAGNDDDEEEELERARGILLEVLKREVEDSSSSEMASKALAKTGFLVGTLSRNEGLTVRKEL